MTEFSYKITENDYGEKLAIRMSSYDASVKDQIKNLDWDTAHPAWDPDKKAWLIDLDEDSISLFEEELDVTVPAEYKHSSEPSYNQDAEIEDALSETISTSIEEHGHGLTTYPAGTIIDDVPVHVYNVLLETGESAHAESEKRQRAYAAMREIRERYSNEAPSMAHSKGLEIIALGQIPGNGKLQSKEIRELRKSGENGTRLLSISNTAERKQIERLFEEIFKKEAIAKGYRVHGIDKILSQKPIPISEGTGRFSLHERYNCSITIEPSGEIYLHVSPRTKVLSDFTLDEISDNYINSGLRVTATYRNRGYFVLGLEDELATDNVIDADTSVVDYHRANPSVSEETVNAIERNNQRVVTVRPMGRGKPTTFPQELLALQGHTSNLDNFDGEFWSAAQPKMRQSGSKRVEKAVEFVQSIGEMNFAGYSVSFSAEEQVFTGDENYQIKRLYDKNEAVIQFADGDVGDRPKQVRSSQVYEPPSSFNIAYIYPEQLSGDRSDKFWSGFSGKLSPLGAKPDSYEEITYEPTPAEESPGNADITVGSAIPHDHDFDAALVVLPPEDGAMFPYYQPYDELKKVLAERNLHSQMCDRGSMNEPAYHTNMALGLISAAGGIPFTVEGSLPGKADLYLAFDVGQHFDDSEEDLKQGVRVGASVAAITKGGAVLGYTHTGAQAGERIPSTQLRQIARQSILGYKDRRGELPEHIVVHRDGFMNDPIDDVLSWLEQNGITYDVVEVRKQAPTRMVKNDGSIANPDKGIACINPSHDMAYLASYGNPEPLADRGSGTPRPITVERARGNTDIETLTRQVYLLSQCHIGVSNTTTRLPITTQYADMAATAAAEGHLPMTTELDTGIGFL